MWVSDNEFGAPWNDQFYIVTVRNEDDIEWEEMLTLSGPRDYDDEDLLIAAQGMFPQVDIINIKPYEICR